MSRLWRAGLTALALILISVAPVAAIKPSDSIVVNETNLVLGDTFTVSYTTQAHEPWVLARCFPNATTEYSGQYEDGSVWGWYRAEHLNGSPLAFTLGEAIDPLWTGGGAFCTVELQKLVFHHGQWKATTLTTESFVVN